MPNMESSQPVRLAVTATVLAGVAALTSGCGLLGKSYDITLEVTGQGTADKITYFFPGDNKGKDLGVTKLPWKEEASTGFGFIDVSATGKGPVTCRILVNGKEVAKQDAPAGQQVACKGNVQD